MIFSNLYFTCVASYKANVCALFFECTDASISCLRLAALCRVVKRTRFTCVARHGNPSFLLFRPLLFVLISHPFFITLWWIAVEYYATDSIAGCGRSDNLTDRFEAVPSSHLPSQHSRSRIKQFF
ncbi:hypothetical protein Naga_100016g60 [Nannochloropsis gaditana]|uniref:Uncharacterized protein n=1 Tax=Nannochloropsis gaditana TaxID=72520 RepID=W7TXS1_9STRA|nr:hypothetical protein Naga_100016g60 [Nannochloropsis gaditana]